MEKWEFGSLEWCQFAGETGVKLIKEANLDLNKFEWGFSEEYTNIPERLLAGREKAGYYFMIHDGKVSGGALLPDECLKLPGFHVVVEWALIAHASSFIYDLKGQYKRGKEEKALNSDLEKIGKGAKKSIYLSKPLWPPGIGESLMGIDGEGLHNITARRLKHSPEIKNFPHSEFGVPILTKMTEEEKSEFIKLLGR